MICAGVIIQLSPSFALRISALPTKDLESVGKVTASQNFARRRLATDVVWLSIPKAWPIYRFDRIFTGEDGRVSVELVGGAAFTILPDSLIQLDMRDGLPIIDLKQGQIEVTRPGEQGLLIRNGLETQKMTARTGPAMVSLKNGRVDVAQIAPSAPEPVADAPPEPRALVAAEATSPTPAVFGSFPKDGAYVYRQKARTLLVSPAGQCTSPCHLVISFDGAIVDEHTFASGQRPQALLDLGAHANGDFKMVLFDGDTTLSTTFFVRPLTEAGIQEALERHAPFEIIE